MKLAHNIGTVLHPNYHTREQVLDCNDSIGFDGLYYSVYENQDVLENKHGVFFVMGNFMGKDNSFDLEFVPKLEKYCSWEQVIELCTNYDFEIGWHTWSHPDLTELSKERIMNEIIPPFPMRYFAYPYGKYDDRVIECVKEAGFESAWSVTQGSTNQNDKDHKYKIFRNYI